MRKRQQTIGIADQIKALYQKVALGEVTWDEAATIEAALHESIQPTHEDNTAVKRSRRVQQVKWRAFACRLPYQLRGHFSDAQASALEALVFLCGSPKNGGAEAQIPIGTIAALAQCSQRTVQYMLRQAIREELVVRQEIKRAKHFNAPSLFTVIDYRLAYLADHMNNQFNERRETEKQSELELQDAGGYEPTEADLAAYAEIAFEENEASAEAAMGETDAPSADVIHRTAGQLKSDSSVSTSLESNSSEKAPKGENFTGARVCTHIKEGLSIPTSGCKSRYQKDSRPSRPPASQTEFPPKAAEIRHSGASAPQNAWQSFQVRVSEAQKPRWATPLGEAALGLIETSEGGLEALAQVVRLDEDNKQFLDIENWRDGVEAIRRRKFPDLKSSYWESRVRIHGDRAYLALLETWLKSATHSEAPIRSPEKYLIGILRRAPKDCLPEVSLRKILTKHAKISPEIAAVRDAAASRDVAQSPHAV